MEYACAFLPCACEGLGGSEPRYSGVAPCLDGYGVPDDEGEIFGLCA